MKETDKLNALWICAGIGAIAIAMFFFVGPCLTVLAVRASKVHETSHPVSSDEFHREVPYIELPSTATNIWYSVSTRGANLYRFDAPISDCLAYAASLIATNNAMDPRRAVPTQLVAVTSSPERINHGMLKMAYRMKSTQWFDVEGILEGWEGHGPPSGLSVFWIDSKRGRFYYYWTE
jgi:hypothetical protein